MKLGELDLFVSLGAIAQWEEVRGKNFLSTFNAPPFGIKDLAEFVFQLHRVASKRQGKNIKLDTEGIMDAFSYKELAGVINEATPEILNQYGISTEVDDTKKKE